ncbi:MAG: Asp-tRNA(Asn)/Glu-tRNA(Gln) amidotransferase subunit GatC [Candidatus Omnitrophica bacterium]|nr:Asp-tRNA(Asn)/Glu-tRNA(Gln) amidotransferase subunit GatC [Candidatus Omnitrophota bacterium]
MEFEIEKIAQLSRLSLKPEELKKLRKDIESILGYIKTLGDLKTGDIEPTSHVLDLENVFRKDDVTRINIRDEVISRAPCVEGPFFKVPKVVDKE